MTRIQNILFIVSCCLITNARGGDPKHYYFFQVSSFGNHLNNPVCRISPIINLKILHDAKKLNYDFSKMPAYTKKEWFGLFDPHVQSFFTPFSKIDYTYTGELGENEKQLKQYFDDCLNHGPIIPHFYDKDGKFPFESFYLTLQIQEVIKFLAIPYFFIDATTDMELRVLGINALTPLSKPDFCYKAPVFQEKGDREKNIVRVFNAKTLQYEPENIKKIDSNVIEIKKCDKPAYSTYIAMGEYKNLGRWYQPKKGSKYIPFLHGIYKLMFLTLGIGHTNEILADNSQATKNDDPYGERDTIIALQNICNADANHPWHRSNFRKENFLPYVIADILIKNPQLANQLEQTIDFKTPSWQQYQKLMQGDYYNKNKEQMTLKSMGKFIPGKEQTLAYLLAQTLRYLWYGSHNPQAFYNWISPYIPLVWTFDSYKQAAQEKRSIQNGFREKASFLDTWQDIRDELQRNSGDDKSWTSYEGHGWILSLEPEVIKLERAFSNKMHDAELNKKLGFAVIESIFSEHLSTFYALTKKNNPKTDTTTETQSLLNRDKKAKQKQAFLCFSCDQAE